MIQTSFEFNSLYFEIYLKFVFCYLGFYKYLQKARLSFNKPIEFCKLLIGHNTNYFNAGRHM